MAVPSLADYKTPWEIKGADYDPDKGKKFVHWLLTKADAAEAAQKKAQDELAAASKERDDFKAEAESFKRKDESEVDRLKRELEEAKKTPAAPPKAEPTARELALEILAENDHITFKQAQLLAKRASGTNKAEVEKDLDELMTLTGIGKAEDDDDAQDRGKPGRRAQTPGGPPSKLDIDPNDPDAMEKAFPRGF